MNAYISLYLSVLYPPDMVNKQIIYTDNLSAPGKMKTPEGKYPWLIYVNNWSTLLHIEVHIFDLHSISVNSQK
jgi:hypothetical protein